MPQRNGRAVAEEQAEAEAAAPGGRRIDLSVAQVAASALAAVVGAVLASELGVYGTIIGAAVVSVGATTGGAVFHHVFRRTGEQLREVTERGSGPSVNGLQQVPLRDTAPLPAAWLPTGQAAQAGPSGPSSEWSDSPVLKARGRRTWKTYAALSGLVFAVAMVPIVGVELAWGKNMHAITTGQDGAGTSIFPGGGHRPDRAPAPPSGGDRSPSTPASPRSSGSASAPASPSSTPSPGASASAGSSPSASPSGSASAPATASDSPSPPPSSPTHSATGQQAPPPDAAAPSGTPSP
ncbi:hypothetical protein P3T36_005617 [Kitasatospora sp. MAP12-15]|uniref:hypothetical protein n=1 Tax=unclassified Kitasatospora TaxID=2633591 RepID=UPI002475C427|nr:hypothetical protein [Kitasatospora sp. MAP12-44]MDH6113138.1 hypothetical protein [Kitasatospora sp. MAP12-44]